MAVATVNMNPMRNISTNPVIYRGMTGSHRSSINNMAKSASSLFINDPILSSSLNCHQYEDLHINRVGSYIELPLSTRQCFINENNYGESYHCHIRRHSIASTNSLSSSIYKSSRSSNSFFSPFAQDSSFRIRKPKKLKLALARMSMSKKSKEKKIPRTKLNTGEKMRGKAMSNKKKKKKFSKLSEELNSSKVKSSSCSVVAPSLSNLSMLNVNNSSNVSNDKKLKCLIAGDAHVGKTALMFLFLNRAFQYEYQPTIVDDYEGKSSAITSKLELCHPKSNKNLPLFYQIE